MEFIQSIGATVIVSLISLVGVILFFRKLTSKSLLISLLVSFAAGTLLGDSFFHLLGESIEEMGFSVDIIISLFLGIIFMLIVESTIHQHHHHLDNEEDDNHLNNSRNLKKDTVNKRLAGVNLVGDSVHNILDGIAIATSFLVNPTVGIATTIAVILHEIPQELADAGILIYSGWHRKKVLIANFLVALTSILGVILVFVLDNLIEGISSLLIPFAAGQFIYIALVNLVPEIHKESNRFKYILRILSFILGITVMYIFTLFE